MRRLIAPAGVLLLLAGAPAAEAHHVTAQATVALEAAPGTAADGSRKAVLSWSVTCSQGAEPEGSVSVMLKPRNAGLAPRAAENTGIAGSDEATGRLDARIAAGRTVFPRLEVACSQLVESEDAEPQTHSARIVVTGGELFVPPRLLSASVERGTWCDAERARRRGHLQALQFYRVEVVPVFSALSMLRGRGRAAYDEVVIVARGAGIRYRKRAAVSRNGLFADIRPRKPGKLAVWLELGGVRTNARTMTVVGIKGGCRREALAIPLS